MTESGQLNRRRLTLQGAFVFLGLFGFVCALSVTERVLKFPNPVQLKLTVGAGSPRVSRRVVVVVVDGLSVEGTTRMPFVEKIRGKGADIVVRTETPSYSRGGYTVLGTGAKPEVTGISSNDVVGRCPADSIFLRARESGLKTGFVGYSWWMEIFGDRFDCASTESSWGPKNKVWSEKIAGPKAQPKNVDWRVLNGQGTYQKINEHWETFVRRERLYDVFGNPRESPLNEDDLRGLEALRMLQENQPDLLYLHLHSPDAWGHDSASHQSEDYFRGCRDADRSIERVAKELDFSKDTLVITSDHGFSSTVRKAGHGGWEDSCSLVPLIIVGRGMKGGVTGRGRQIDLVSHLAILLGLPFPTSNQGEPFWDAFDIDGELIKLNKRRWIKARRHFLAAYSRSLGMSASTVQSVEGHGDFAEAFAQFRWECWQLKLTGMLLRGVLTSVVVLLVLVALRRFMAIPLSYAVVSYGVFEGSFLALHFAFLGVYSFSVASSGPALGEAVLLFTMLAGGFALAATHLMLRRAWRVSLETVWASVCLGALVHSGLCFVLVGLGPDRFMGHGLLLYGSIIAHTQTFLVCVLGTSAVSFGLFLTREKAAEEDVRSASEEFPRAGAVDNSPEH